MYEFGQDDNFGYAGIWPAQNAIVFVFRGYFLSLLLFNFYFSILVKRMFKDVPLHDFNQFHPMQIAQY
jgi:hypothetical protein